MINEDVFRYNELTPEEKQQIYNVFRDSYEKAVGTSWSQSKFESRAQNWLFLGDKNEGFITLRKQQSGLHKLTGTAGSIKGVMKGLEDLKNMNVPVWGMMDDKLASILEKRYGFIRPSKFVIKTLLKFIPSSVFGDVDFTVNDDGSMTLQYSDVGDATKFFIGNKEYFKFLVQNILPQMAGVPKMVVFAIKKMIGLNENNYLENIVNEEIIKIKNPYF